MAFNTQPGHIPARARMNRADDRAFESLRKAGSMRERADGIEAQLERSIYSDDPDSSERLNERIAELEAQRGRIKAYNASCRKGSPDPSILNESERDELASLKRVAPYQLGANGALPAYKLRNLAGEIKRNRDRLADLDRRARLSAAAAQAGGVSIIGDSFVNVVFAQRPEPEVLRSLKDAGFHRSAGVWHGYRDRLPTLVLQMQQGGGDG